MKLLERLIPDSRIYACMSLFPGKSAEEVRKNLTKELKTRMFKVLPPVLLIPLLFLGADLLKKEDPYMLQRSDVNGEVREIPLVLKNGTGEYEVVLELKPVSMSDEEIDEMQAELEKVLDPLVLGVNSSFDEVFEDLCFPEEMDEFPVLLTWSTSEPGIVRSTGEVRKVTDEKIVTICAKVSYGEEFRLYERLIKVVPPMYSESEAEVQRQILELRAYEEEKGHEKEFVLPGELAGAQVDPVKKGKVSPAVLGAILGAALGLGAWSNFFGSLNEKKKKRLTEAESECKEFLSKLSVLLAAGLPLRGAWKKMTEDMERDNRKSMLSENMSVTVREFMNGCPENVAYERFGERMELVRYQRIAAVLAQAVTKGVSELPELLAAEIREAVADEREQIKIRGEQAGTKLLMPMMGFLIVVFAILLVPAFISF